MQTDITFLHTAEVHIETFEKLINDKAPNLKVKHIVDSELLENAISHGLTESLKDKVADVLRSHSKHSRIMVCSCSTLGEIAEQTKLDDNKSAIRIDRAMADLAVNSGKNILVLAALESTLLPTEALMVSSRIKEKTDNNIDYCVVEGSWQYFLNANTTQYLQSIADTIEVKKAHYDCIVLAQASMAGAAELVEKGPLILSSPSIGVDALLEKLVQ